MLTKHFRLTNGQWTASKIEKKVIEKPLDLKGL